MESLHTPQPTTRQLLRRLAIAFAFAFTALTSVLLFNYAMRQDAGRDTQEMWTLVVLALPFTAALTIPMAVFIAVLLEFTRLGAKGTLDAARRRRDGVRRLIAPVLAAAAGIAALAFVVTAEIVPRSNARLAAVSGRVSQSDRSMTIGELRQAAQDVPVTESEAISRAAAYEVELQKKIALPAACVVLALAGMAIAFRIPRGGVSLVIVASLVVFGAYYVMLMTGESLADALIVSPLVAMWGANAIMLTVALLAFWRRRSSLSPDGHSPVVIRD